MTTTENWLSSLLSVPLCILRIQIGSLALIETIFILIMIHSATSIYYFVLEFSDLVLSYNCSFVVKHYLEISDGKDLNFKSIDFHNLLKSYTYHTHLELFKRPDLIKIIKRYMVDELTILSCLLDDIKLSRNSLETACYVVIPQVNKNFSKRIKTYQVLNYAKANIIYRLKLFVLPFKYRYLYDNMNKILGLFLLIKMRENITILDEQISNMIRNIISKTEDLNRNCNLGLKQLEISEMLLFCSNY